jgi:WD40 repeat protein
MSTINNAHNEQISNFSHYSDEANYRDLVLSISSKDNSIKLWNINQLKCLCYLRNIYYDGYLNSACFINDYDNIFFLTCNFKYRSIPDLIKVYNCNGDLVRQINNSNCNTVFIDTYYDKNLGKNYIVTGNYECIKSYDYDNNLLYKIYCDKQYYDDSNKKEVYGYHDSIKFDDKGEIIKLVDSSGKGRIRIWEFHTANLIKVIEINKYGAFGICLWDNNYIFAGSKRSIKLIDVNKQKVIKKFGGHDHEIITIKKIEIPKYGKCLISQDRENGSIILWTTE